MASKTSFFDITLAKKAVKRTFPAWLLHLVIWIFAMPVLLGNISKYISDINELSYYILSTMYIGGILMAAFFSGLMSELLCNYLYSPKSVSLYHSIPVKRSTIYLTHLTVGVGALLVPAAIVGLMTQGVLALKGIFSGWVYIAQWFWMYVCMVTFFTGLSLLCCHITGHVGIGSVVYIIFNFLAIVMEAVIRFTMSHFVYGFSFHGGYVTKPFSPIYYFYAFLGVERTEPNTPYHFTGFSYLNILLLVGVGFIIAAWLIYRYRRSESAGDIISLKPLRPVFKYCFTAGFALCLGLIFYLLGYESSGDRAPNGVLFTFCMLLGGAIGYFAAEMLLKKSFKVFKKGLAGFILPGLIILSLGLGMTYDLFGIEGRVPDAASIEKVRILNGYDIAIEVQAGDPFMDEALDFHRLVIADRDDILGSYYGSPAARPAGDSGYYSFHSSSIVYTLKDGSSLTRNYWIPYLFHDTSGPTVKATPTKYTEAMAQLASHPEVIMRACAGLWDEDYKVFSSMVNIYRVDEGFVGDLYLKPELYERVRELVKAGLLDGTLLGSAPTKATIEETPVNHYGLDVSLRKGDHNGDYEDTFYYFDVAPKCKELYDLLSRSESYVQEASYEKIYGESLVPDTVAQP